MRRDWIFLHITKTGGVSIAKDLKRYIKISEHTTVKTLNENRKILSCTRNPYDRVFSQYEFYKNKRTIIPTGSTFKEFVMSYEDFNKKYRYRDEEVIFATIFDLTSIDGVIKVDRFLRFEKLSADFNVFCKQELNKNIKLSHLNHNNKKLVFDMKYYDEEMLNNINRIFNNDFLHFEYEKIEK